MVKIEKGESVSGVFENRGLLKYDEYISRAFIVKFPNHPHYAAINEKSDIGKYMSAPQTLAKGHSKAMPMFTDHVFNIFETEFNNETYYYYYDVSYGVTSVKTLHRDLWK